MTKARQTQEAVSSGAAKAVVTNYNHKCKDKACKDLHREVGHDSRA